MPNNEISLSTEAIKAVRDNADLYAEVAKALDVAPTYLATILRKNDPRLTQMNILKLISASTGIEMHELVVEPNLNEVNQ